MLHFPLGIRKKITLGFFLLLFLMLASAALTYGFVSRVEQKIVYMEIIDDFLNTTLELRRFEKNYFLYTDENDFQENMTFVEKLTRLLYQNIKLLSSLMTHDAYLNLWDTAHAYKENMDRLHLIYQRVDIDTLSPDNNLIRQLEETIRSQGKKLTSTAEQTSKLERKAIQEILQTTGKVLLLSILVFVTLCIAIAFFLGRDIVNSLKLLERHTKQISRGEFVAAPINVADQEIKSLLQAFNRMTTELRVRQHQLVQSEKLASLGTLLSGVAHELNNPLSNISTSAQILSEEIEEPDLEYKKDLIQQVMEQSDRARDIVKTLLEFSRIREFSLEKLFLQPMIEETILLLRGQVPSTVAIQLEIPTDLMITADKQRMQQVFLNLMKNAIDVVGSEGHVWISAQEVMSERKRKLVEILIEDDGPGIPHENLPRIFDPFYTTKDVGHGSGLGLFIVHDIIEWHGGSIRVDSRPGEGTTFIIWIPVKEEITNG